MIRFFRTLQPATLIIIPLIIVVFWARALFHSMPVSDANAGILWHLITSVLVVFPSWVNFIILISIVSWQAIYLNLFLNRFEVLYKNTFVPALIYAIFISCSPLLMQFHPVHLINLLILLIFNEAFALYKNENPTSKLFDTGFFTGLAALIYFPALILLPLLFTTVAILRPFRLKEYLVVMVGFCLPFFFISTYMFWTHSLPEFLSSLVHPFNNIRVYFSFHKSTPLFVLTIYFAVLLVFSLLKVRMNYRKNVIRTRSYQQIFLIFLIYVIGGVVLSGVVGELQVLFAVIPITVFSAYYFMSAKKRLWLYEYALWALVVIIVWNHLVQA